MKKFLIAILCSMSFAVCAQQKNITEKDVPQKVLDGFQLAYPDIQVQSWALKNKRYVATLKDEDKTEYATFLEDGEWLETRSEVEKAEIPEKIQAFVLEHYSAYRINTVEYVEENKGGNYFFVPVSLRSNKNVITELIFDTEGNLLMLDGMPIEQNSENAIIVNENIEASVLKPGIQKESENSNEGIPEAVLEALKKRYGNVEKITWSKNEFDFHRAVFKFRDEVIGTEWADDGSQVSVVNFFTKKNLPYIIEKFLTEEYPKAKLLAGERVVYESRFNRANPDYGFKNYFMIKISDKPRGSKITNYYTIYFDHTGQLDIIVEDKQPQK